MNPIEAADLVLIGLSIMIPPLLGGISPEVIVRRFAMDHFRMHAKSGYAIVLEVACSQKREDRWERFTVYRHRLSKILPR